MAELKIKPFRKVYTDENGEKIALQPVICSACGYDSAMDDIANHNYCPNCGEPIESIVGHILLQENDDN